MRNLYETTVYVSPQEKLAAYSGLVSMGVLAQSELEEYSKKTFSRWHLSNLFKFILDFRDLENDIVAKAKSTNIFGYNYEDITQELRLAIWLACDKYDQRKASPRTFAVRIMNNKIIDLWRKCGSR